jgi:stage II sporulation protein D
MPGGECMKNPILILLCLVICSVAAPILITAVSYNETELSSSNKVTVAKADKEENKADNKTDVKSEKILNLETVNKESPKIDIYNHKLGKYQKIDLEEYLSGVLAGEMSPDFDIEALRAQAIAARTYVMYKMDRPYPSRHKKAVVCTDFKHCQEYKSYSELQKINGKEWMKSRYFKIQEAVKSTKGQIIAYDDKAILPLYFSTSSGKTENSEEVFSASYPYLKSVDSPYDKISPKFISKMSMSNKEFVNSMKRANGSISLSELNLENQISVVEKSKGGAVDKIKIGNKTFAGTEIRTIFGLNSANFEIVFNGENLEFNVKGYGHGVGMSQWGAEGMAKDGSKYYEILSHYYSNTSIKDIY